MHQRLELVERIILETRPSPWVALSNGGSGILAYATTGLTLESAGYDEGYRGARHFGLAFAYRVVAAMEVSPAQKRVPTPQILVDSVAAVQGSLAYLDVLCTTWQRLPEGVEICSVGVNSVLLFEGDTVREVISRHTVNEFLRHQGHQEHHSSRGEVPTHALGGDDPCKVEDVRVTLVTLLPTSTIAIIHNRRVVEAVMQQAVPREELPSFIERWVPPARGT